MLKLNYQSFAVTNATRSLSVSRCVGNFGSGESHHYGKLHNLVTLGLFCVLADRFREGKPMCFSELIGFLFLFLLNFPELTGELNLKIRGVWGDLAFPCSFSFAV